MIETVEISCLEYFNLRKAAEKLRRLEGGGVNNWGWYGDSVYGEDHQDWDEFEEELKDKIWPRRKDNKE